MKNRGVEKILKKLKEYGFKIYNQYSDDDGNYYFMIDNMVISYDINCKVLSIAFKASTKPEVVANNVLILKEVDEIKDFIIMESFIYKGTKILSGKEAHKYIEETHGKKEVGKYIREQNELDILLYSKYFGHC